MGLYSFFKKLVKAIRHKLNPVPVPKAPCIDTVHNYPFLPNFYHALDEKAHSQETIQKFFERIGYPYVTVGECPVREAGAWAENMGIECISSIMRVSNSFKKIDLNNDYVTMLGHDLGFVAFKKPEDCFLFKIMFPEFD